MKRLISVLVAAVLVFGLFPVYAADTGIVSVEVTQVMGKGIDLPTGKYYFMNTFVANKPAAIQVVMSESYNFTSSDTVTVYRDGTEIATITPDKAEKSQIMTYTPPKDAVSSWAAGRYKFTANIGGNSHSTEAIFNDSREFSVLAVGASVKYNGEVFPAPKMDSDTITLRTQALPVSENKLIRRYIGAPISFGTGENGYDLSTSDGPLKLLSDIESYRLKSAANYDVVVVVVDSYISESKQNSGYTDSEHAVVLSLKSNPDPESLTASLLHEIGHIFGNGDEYENGAAKPDVNGLPYGVKATDSSGTSITGNREYLSHAKDNTYSGILIDDAQNPYNPKSGGVMLNTSSFMGSSYSHWTTSMVWEEAYEKLIPNYQNVLPKVYTDGTLVPERNLDNSLSEEKLAELRDDWYAMCNEVRAEKGYKAYTFDEYFDAGEKNLQKTAEDTMKKGETEVKIAVNNVLEPMGMFAIERSSMVHIHEWLEGDLEYFKGFFTESDCGAGAISDDYMVIAYMEVGGRLYYVWDSYHDLMDLAETADPVLPQPETKPALEINPVDNAMPAEQADDEAVTEPEVTETEAPQTEAAAEYVLPAFEDYPDEWVERLNYYDIFDVSLSELPEIASEPYEPYEQWPNAAAYFGWWAGQEYGADKEMTGEYVMWLLENEMLYGDINQLGIVEFIRTYCEQGLTYDSDGNPYVMRSYYFDENGDKYYIDGNGDRIYPDGGGGSHGGDGDIDDPDGNW
ncbi:MAG: hypothetical protein LBL98_00075 [Ruminococcus sp.]|nr:hypothetical protein [Ruminococcus sp.]